MTHRSVAFLVGVDRFSDSVFTPLRFCQNDVDGMARVLRNAEIGGFEIVEVRNKRHDEVLESLERTVASLVPGDRLLFYFAGHGRRSRQSGRLYLVATNTKSDALRATGVPIESALDIIRESRCDNRALVLDCCHSGAVGEGFRGGDLASGLDDLARKNSGTYILTASTAIQLAAERESAAGDGASGNGIFTKYFIEALETGAASPGDSDDITIDAVYDYIQQRVTVQASQQPQRFVIGGAGRFVVARSSAGLWERRRDELGRRCLELNHQNVISDDDYMAAAKIFRAPWPTLTPSQRASARVGLDMLDGKATVSQFCFRPETPRAKQFRLGATIKVLLVKLRLPTSPKSPQLGAEAARLMVRSTTAGALGAAIGFGAAAQIEPVYESFAVNDLFFLLLLFCTVFGVIAGMLLNLIGIIAAAMIPGVALNSAWLLMYASRPEGFLRWRWANFWAVDLYMYPWWGLAASLGTFVAFYFIKLRPHRFLWRRTRKTAQ